MKRGILILFVLFSAVLFTQSIDKVRFDSGKFLVFVGSVSKESVSFEGVDLCYIGNNYNYVEDAIIDGENILEIYAYRRASGDGFIVRYRKIDSNVWDYREPTYNNIWNIPYEDVSLYHGELYSLNNDFLFLGSVGLDGENFLYLMRIDKEGNILDEKELDFENFLINEASESGVEFLAYKSIGSGHSSAYLCQVFSYSGSLSEKGKQFKLDYLPDFFANGKYYRAEGWMNREMTVYEFGKKKRKRTVKIPFSIPSGGGGYPVLGHTDDSFFTLGLDYSTSHTVVIEIGLDGKLKKTFDLTKAIMEKYGLESLDYFEIGEKRIFPVPWSINLIHENNRLHIFYLLGFTAYNYYRGIMVQRISVEW
ncbi:MULTISPECIES: hypothetical protein [Thermotoga]|uniref:Uncharacterized protein n=2 Tax=Thermotoga TaxID=2335 RepID=B9K9V3_THENN|nr:MULTISPECIES: hypothetical protein [Thermotoga]KUK23424.1 MAG: Uncharacterized protein XD57_0471 [Thermotoga petrophila]KUK33464.1 MAG: Uncharacterized protein XD64_0706 [Thermotoga sp. 47_83]HBF69534.1 hypothetical protein [Thermotoga sp.]ACB10118.1 conserved hypothetical protein [Thermotoga sp. RQ2]ACM23736.1 Putative uncharacterized protein precursor [Thermotoga neapolitana DSM 4359]